MGQKTNQNNRYSTKWPCTALRVGRGGSGGEGNGRGWKV